jgi:hypothetical protein
LDASTSSEENNVNPLNPTLYQALVARFGAVKVYKQGQPNTTRPSPNWHRQGRLQNRVVEAGEYYAVRCPYCGDQRFRLWINHGWGVRDPLSGNDNLHLAKCFNEDCLDNRPRQLQLQRMLDPFDDEVGGVVVAPAAAADEWATPPSEPTLPDGSVPINELPSGHPAVAYLQGRNFDVQELWERWQVRYCEHSPLSTPPLRQRLVIPIFRPGGPADVTPQLAGWAARAITPSLTDGPKYLFNAGLRASQLLYGLPAALHTVGPLLLTEGPTDVWRVGPGSVALLGKSMSPTQRRELLRLARGRPVVVLLDRDAGVEARKIRDSLRAGRHQEAGDRRVVAAQVPNEAKDPADSTTDQVWAAVEQALAPPPPLAPVGPSLIVLPAGEEPYDWTIEPEGPSRLEVALDYLARGIWVLPQEAGEKKPCIRWKQYQDRPPTDAELKMWYAEWPNAGMVAILGRRSRVFAIDVDGPEAHAALVSHLGTEPVAPKVLSGSRKPHRYHLFFRHPDIPTKARYTPWHEHLEFRGHGGIVVLPPSEHKSGNLYAWAPDQSLDDLELPEVPGPILEALAARAAGAT